MRCQMRLMANCSASLKVVRSESVLNATAGISVRPTTLFHSVLLTISPVKFT